MQKYTFKVQKYTFKLQKYTFKVQQYTVEIQKYTSKVQKCPFKVQKYTFEVQKYTFKVQSNFRNLGNRISWIRNLLNTFGSRNPVPRSRNHWNRFLEPRNPGVYPVPGTIGTGSWNLQPWNLSQPRNLEPITYPNLGTLEPVPGTSSPGTHPNLGTLQPIQTSEPWNLSKPRNPSEPVPGTVPGTFPEPVFSPEPPQLAQHTPKSILCRDPIAFCCCGKKHTFFSTSNTAFSSFFFGGKFFVFSPSGSPTNRLGKTDPTWRIGKGKPSAESWQWMWRAVFLA